MIAGYALVAYPSNYGNTGVMTFTSTPGPRLPKKSW